MSKKLVMGIIVALIIIVVIIGIVLLIVGPKNQGTNGTTPQSTANGTQAELDAAIKAEIETLKPTCTAFLAGDLSGKPDTDCPGFDKQINKDLCYYCYAVKNQDIKLCDKVNPDSGLRVVCQGANGSSTDKILNK